jgi:N-ethylmaleimide reductase
MMPESAIPATPPATRPPTGAETLFQPVRVGPFTLPHRLVMAPLTRSRARQPGNVPTPLNACYYAQRASAALIISEATQVSLQGQGYAWTPGIHSREQVEGWRQVTAAVHEADGLIFLQLWHVGRISHPALQPDGMLPVAPSAIKPAGQAFIENAKGEGELVPFVTPRALQTEEMPYLIRQYGRGAKNALEAGFDGVEIHAANGYLLDQFLNSSTNQRTDAYGGSVENRARLMLEVTDAVVSVWGAGRVGMHLAPRGDTHSMGDSDRAETFGYVATELGKRRIAFICAREHVGDDSLGSMLKQAFGGPWIANEKFTRETAQAALDAGTADAVAFGKAYIANPDLVERFASGAPLNPWNMETFYSPGAAGYIDYPALRPTQAAAD